MSQPLPASSSSGVPSDGGPSRRVPRGAACLNCRRRKMRCDGARPVCGQCIRTKREYDCEYTDGPGPSPTQMLEDKIARLESRIHELEHPELVGQSVMLNPTNTLSRAQSPSVSLLDRLGTPDPWPFSIPGPSGQLHSPALSQDPLIEPPDDLVRSLVNAFIPHSSSLSFFLNAPRFTHAIQLPYGDPRRAQLSPALLNAVYLWGAHLSSSDTVRAHGSMLLSRATTALTSDLRESRYNVMHLIQAEVLVANYFFSMSRFLEGRYHCSAAVALALSCRLAKIRSSTDQGRFYDSLGTRHVQQGQELRLAPPRDSVEEGERIRGFWYVYALDKTWAVALGSPSHFNGITQVGSQVDTPWPLEMSQYEAGGMPPGFRSALTVHNFVSGGSVAPFAGGDSHLTLRAKAAMLFERATHLASRWSAATTNHNEFFGSFMALDGLIDRFTASLPPVDGAGNADVALTCLVTHTLARAATIQLRSSFKDSDRMNDRKDLAAAQAAAAMLETFNVNPTNVDPILAILWTAVCRVLIGEIVRLDASSSSHPPSASHSASSTLLHQLLQVHPSLNSATAATAGPSSSSAGTRSPQRTALRAMLDQVLGVMNRFRDTSPLMAVQYAELRKGLDARDRIVS